MTDTQKLRSVVCQNHITYFRLFEMELKMTTVVCKMLVFHFFM